MLHRILSPRFFGPRGKLLCDYQDRKKIIRTKMSRSGTRRHDAISTGDYTICVESADKPKGGCRGTIYVKLLGDGKVGDEDELCVAEFPEKISRGHKNFFKVDEPKIRNIDGIEIRGDAMVGKDGWNIDKVMVTNNKTGVETVLPVFANIRSDRTYKFMTDDLSLPHLSSKKEDRKRDLEEMRELYELTEKYPGCPPLVKKLPPEEKFSYEYKFHIGGKLKALEALAAFDKATSGAFHKLDDIKSVYGIVFPKPSNLERWKNDELFGMQRLMSVNPCVIRLCTKIPDKLAVNGQMLKPFLESMTLPQALQKKRIFIIDYDILDGLPTRAGYVMCAPIALFYQKNNGKLVPIAIQLFQKPSANNPVFLPTDPPTNTWILAKMWFNVADANYHQSVAHLGFTHLKMEGIVACTHRQIHKDHPIFRLLMPHFLYLIAINNIGIPILLNEHGYVAELLNLGTNGMVELMKRKNEKWRMDVDGTLSTDLKVRGVDDQNLLPHYYYRNDAIPLYDAIRTYVRKYLDLYYASDVDVQEDYELQNWRQEIVAPVDQQGLGMLGVYGENGKFITKEQVCHTLTSIIFTCSVQHAAVNFRQYEDYAYPPNYPLGLRGSPPKGNGQIEDIELLQSLPQKTTTYDTLVITNVLSTRGMNKLGNFEVHSIIDKKALEVVEEFRADLTRIANDNKEKNNGNQRIENYWCLNPNYVPNSISI
ncbi:polyunsaturated fatty acid 5-lipoxygenase-like [Mercenaria mercenaria]|uniref:polyunsaturated fatty acid 5-lipoxygenase-like n=1 Tax=Mercenaria mercenaria TaxID=6596 RepID=UPI00234F4FBC|nr:polyunsaturated fatty acid 5-lipoxygenase-like [Mercenaria mercenaria]